MNKRAVGKVWEDFATGYIIKKGHKILFRNWVCRWGEIDIITVLPEKDCLVFVEVKFRNGKFGYAHEAVNFYKIQSLKRAAGLFIKKEKPAQSNFRFDVIAVTKFPGRVQIEHFEAVGQEW